jgi:hypothetical protein
MRIIERHPFGGQQSARRPGDPGNHRSRLHPRAIIHQGLEADRRVDQPERGFGQRQSRR